jgi:hypothetical protein
MQPESYQQYKVYNFLVSAESGVIEENEGNDQRKKNKHGKKNGERP